MQDKSGVNGKFMLRIMYIKTRDTWDNIDMYTTLSTQG